MNSAETLLRAIDQLIGLGLAGPTDSAVSLYRRDFDNLWQFDGEFPAADTTRCRLCIVVGTAAPPGGVAGINLARYLSALDWAIAMSLRYVAKGGLWDSQAGRLEEPPWRIFLLETTRCSQSACAAHELFRRLQVGTAPFLPWIHFSRPGRLLADLWTASTVAPALAEAGPCALVRRLWTDEFTRRGPDSEAHSIANLVGPRALIRAMASPADAHSTDASLRAFDALLAAIGLTPRETHRQNSPWVNRIEWRQAGIERWVLIDDMHDLGWSRFLRLALDLRDDELETLEMPPSVRKLLEQRGAWDNRVLLLDLRLFARSSWEQERGFLETILQTIESGRFRSEFSTPWGAFTTEDIACVRRCIGKIGRAEDQDYHVALTALPRLIARAFPTLPIILFSSTGRKEIAEMLRPCANIVMDFSKPHFSMALSPEFVTEARRHFGIAVRRAIALAHARASYRRVAQEASGAVVAGGSNSDLKRPTRTTGEIVEFYIDESHARAFAVGGIVVCYPDETVVAEFDDALKEEALVWGLAEGHAPLLPTDAIPDFYLPKEHRNWGNYERDLRRILDAMERVAPEIRIAGFGLVQQRPPVDTGPLLLREDSLDNLYHFMLEELCCHLLLEWLPHYSPSAATIRIDVATRLNRASDKAELARLRQAFGINAHPAAEGRYFSLETSDVHRVVAKLLAGESHGRLTIDRARGVTLFDYGEIQQFQAEVGANAERYRRRITNTLRPKQIHFLADWFSRFASNPELRQSVPTARKLFQRGFLQSRHAAYRRLMAAAQHARHRRAVDCVLEADQALRGDRLSASGKYALGRWQMRTISGALKRFSGHDFIELAERLSLERGTPS